MTKSNLEAMELYQVDWENTVVSIEDFPWYKEVSHYLRYIKCHDYLDEN